jgi:hypothetical protein
MLKIVAEYDRDTSSAKLKDFFAKFSLLSASVDICQRAVVDESGMIRTQMRKQNRLENGHSTWDALCDTTLQQ